MFSRDFTGNLQFTSKHEINLSYYIIQMSLKAVNVDGTKISSPRTHIAQNYIISSISSEEVLLEILEIFYSNLHIVNI